MTDKTEAQPEALRLAEAQRYSDVVHHANVKASLAYVARKTGLGYQETERLLELALKRGDLAEGDYSGRKIENTADDRLASLKAQLVAQANRAAAAEQQVTALTQRLDMANRLNTDARNQLAQLSARQAATDAIGHVRIDAGEVHIYPRNRDAESSALADGQLVYAAAPPPPEREPHPPTRHCMCADCAPSFYQDNAAPEREPLSDLQKQALAVYLPPFQFSHGYVFDSAGRMVADEGREHELDQLASTVGVRIRGWGHLGKLKNGAEVQDTIGELAAAALNAYWKQHGIGATND